MSTSYTVRVHDERIGGHDLLKVECESDARLINAAMLVSGLLLQKEKISVARLAEPAPADSAADFVAMLRDSEDERMDSEIESAMREYRFQSKWERLHRSFRRALREGSATMDESPDFSGMSVAEINALPDPS